MNNSNKIYGIGFVAQRYGISAEALRIWERDGLIPAARRTPGGHRRYTQDHITAIDRIIIAPVAPSSFQYSA